LNKLDTIFHQIKVWVLAPHLETADANIDYYYDFTQSIEEYTKTFAELNIVWQWQPVTINNYQEIIDTIIHTTPPLQPIIFNLCDGDEMNGTPGISVIHYLEEKKMVYTGADAFFYHITTSKVPMKRAFDEHQVTTAKWKAITNAEENIENIFTTLGNPIIVKPAVSGGSMGVSVKNVVNNQDELTIQIKKMFAGYRGWQLATDGIIAEAFIDGPEYTVLIVGNYLQPENAIIYTPVERVFHASLPAAEKFLSFDRLWEIYEDETPMPNDENFYEYQPAPSELQEAIKELAWRAYVACKGTGYTRADIRMDNSTKKMYVLEVNAQCGLSEDEDYTSIGAILKVSEKSFTSLVSEILYNAISKNQ
jgi:D-alanine-D-alanine ligase